MRFVNIVSADEILWICEQCPIAARTIIRDDRVDFNIDYRPIENYTVYFVDDAEFMLFSLRWL